MRHSYCVACGSADGLEQRHIVPRSLEASDLTITLCGTCHSLIHDMKTRSSTSELTKAGIERRRAKGLPIGSPATLAAHRDKGTATVKKQASSYAATAIPKMVALRKVPDYEPVATLLNAEPFLTPRKHRWAAQGARNYMHRYIHLHELSL